MLTMLLGAALALGSQAAGASRPPGTPTFSRDIAPLVHRACTPCHRPGQPVPFALVTYQDVRRRAQLVAAATRDRLMPPWQPEQAHETFADARRLTDAEIELLARWAAAGAPEGNPTQAPAPPRFDDGWTLGTPGHVIRFDRPYRLASSGPDQVHTFVIPSGVTSRRFVRAIAFDPGQTQAIHHANIKIDTSRSSRWLDEQDPSYGYEGAGGRGARFPDGHFLGWTPGQSTRITEEAPWQIDPGADLVVELHLTPTGKQEQVQPAVALYFTERQPGLSPYMLRLGRQDLDIDAGNPAYRAEDQYTLPVDVEVLAVQPHAHSLATSVRGTATLPDGTRVPLITIAHWNPRWQDAYRYASPLRLPRGSVIDVQYTFDNSASNPRNPHAPPARVTFGQSARSEMGDLWLQVSTANAAERAALDRDYAPKMLQEDIAGARKVLDANPTDPRAHADLAFCYEEAGQRADALRHLRTATRLAPNSAGAHVDLGVALIRRQALKEAREELTTAVRLKPDVAEAYTNLGAISHLEGRPAEALEWYARARRINAADAENEYNAGRAHAAVGDHRSAVDRYQAALRIAPDDPATLASLGGSLVATGAVGEAVVAYRRALEVRTDYAPALVDLAWILATSNGPVRNPAEAVTLAERARASTGGQSPTVLDTVSVAYAAAGRRDDAIRAATDALARARAIGADALVASIQARLDALTAKR